VTLIGPPAAIETVIAALERKVEHADPDVPLPTSLIREPILPQHREIVMEL